MDLVAVKHAQFLAIRADPGRVWPLLLSPAMRSMPTTGFMFAVPGAGQFRFWIGLNNGWFPATLLYELAVDDNARSVTLRQPPPPGTTSGCRCGPHCEEREYALRRSRSFLEPAPARPSALPPPSLTAGYTAFAPWPWATAAGSRAKVRAKRRPSWCLCRTVLNHSVEATIPRMMSATVATTEYSTNVAVV